LTARDQQLASEIVSLLSRGDAPCPLEELEAELAAPRPRLERALKFALDSGLITETATVCFEFMPISGARID
jgi:hypothetical protein